MILNLNFIKSFITRDSGDYPVPYRWSHGSTDYDMGDGILIYSIIQMMRYKTCVCIGTGGGYIPRIMTQARIDLHKIGTFTGNPDYNWGDVGTTYVVDPCNGIGGKSNAENPEGFFQRNFYPRFIKETSEKAYYDFFILQDIKIDLLFIDGDHSYEGVKLDFSLYKNIINPNGIIIIHDTDPTYCDNFIVSEDEKKDFHDFRGPSIFVQNFDDPEWEKMDFFNYGSIKDKPASSGITLFKRKKI